MKIEAETSKDQKEESKCYLKQERFVSSYMRMVTLPEDANAEKYEYESEYTDGVLKITIPKKKK
jgi:HSP20 family molecular chaperone IbpA